MTVWHPKTLWNYHSSFYQDSIPLYCFSKSILTLSLINNCAPPPLSMDFLACHIMFVNNPLRIKCEAVAIVSSVIKLSWFNSQFFLILGSKNNYIRLKSQWGNYRFIISDIFEQNVKECAKLVDFDLLLLPLTFFAAIFFWRIGGRERGE